MRISDWSSDVCSSDLCQLQIFVLRDGGVVLEGLRVAFLHQKGLADAVGRLREGHFLAARRGDEHAGGDDVEAAGLQPRDEGAERSEAHTSELQSLMRISYAVFCLKKKTTQTQE